MARNALPVLDVKEKIISKRIGIPSTVDDQLSQFIEFFESQSGNKPESGAVIVAILREYFSNNIAFQKYLKDAQKGTTNEGKRSEKVKQNA